MLQGKEGGEWKGILDHGRSEAFKFGLPRKKFKAAVQILQQLHHRSRGRGCVVVDLILCGVWR